MNSNLAETHCAPCEGGLLPLDEARQQILIQQLPGWVIEGGHHLRRVYNFPDFKSALACVNRIGAVAEEEGHHPNIELSWGKVALTLWTHSVDGVTDNDFTLAARIEFAAKTWKLTSAP